jgi:hypothetical protein
MFVCLIEQSIKKKEKKMSFTPIDYSSLKIQNLPSWQIIYNDKISFVENIYRWSHESCYLSNEFLHKLILIYSLVPSALCDCLPILFLYGNKGTGKSTTLELISYLWDIPINSSADSFSAIRNDLNKRRWKKIKSEHDPDEHINIELNSMMLWDDIDPAIFESQPNIFRMLKCGYKKATDTISIAGPKGKNITFNCFSPKIFSTIKPIWGNYKYTEIERRSLVIKFKKAPSPKYVPSLNLAAYNWSGLSQLTHSLWDKRRALRWLGHKSLLINSLPNNSRTEITVDLMATALALDIFNSIDSCLEYFTNYWQWYDDSLAMGDSALCGLLKNFIKETLIENKKYQLKYNADNPDLEEKIAPGILRKQVDIWYNCGMLEDKPTAKLLTQAMNYLGWQLVPNKWVKF